MPSGEAQERLGKLSVGDVLPLVAASKVRGKTEVANFEEFF